MSSQTCKCWRHTILTSVGAQAFVPPKFVQILFNQIVDVDCFGSSIVFEWLGQIFKQMWNIIPENADVAKPNLNL